MGKRNVVCNNCNTMAVLKQTKHGRKWECPSCKASVGCHPGTKEPLGTFANRRLSDARMEVHKVFDVLWSTPEERTFAYEWLATVLRIPRDKCHIGMFDLELCRKAIAACLSNISRTSYIKMRRRKRIDWSRNPFTDSMD